jgi:Flp pilus assembly CpaE family ATPase
VTKTAPHTSRGLRVVALVSNTDQTKERETMKREKNYVVYSRETGSEISYHKSAVLADKAARKIDPALRKADSKRIS